MDDLIAFLKARLNEDERVAIGAHAYDIEADEEDLAPRGVVVEPAYRDFVDHFTPARMRREIDAKRKIIAEYKSVAEEADRESDDDRALLSSLGGGLKALVLPYSDHRDYREDWRP